MGRKTKSKQQKEAATKHTKPSEQKTDALQQRLEEAMRAVRARFGEEAIVTLREAPQVDVDVIPSGSLGLDWALGIGGYPRGRMVEIYGPESSGKTTLALHAVAEAQRKGGIAAFIDAEHALDPEYAKRIGVHLDRLLISQPDTGEQALEIVEQLVRTGTVDIIVVDSVAALAPRDEIEGDMGAQHIGKQARLMSQALRKLTAIVHRSRAVVIFINQVRMQIGVMFGNPEITPGGRALKFYSSVRLDIRRIAQIKKGEEVVGGRHRVKVVKNKVAPPFRQTEFDLLYNEGISREGEMLALGERFKIITKEGATYTFGEHKLGRGYDAARTFLRTNKEVARSLLKEIRAALKAAEAKEVAG